jgi:ubiquinone/menaquinone biosynthesis C-methylase UbiE
MRFCGQEVANEAKGLAIQLGKQMYQGNCSTYVMGATEHERRRLLLQGSILNPLTNRFLKQAGISEGMHVLDLGCGIGDVTLIAAHIVGPHGSVTGLDPDSVALDTAQARAHQGNLLQVTFEHAGFEAYTPDRQYDAVVGRHVLIHSPDPLEWMRRINSLLRSAGIAAFQEYDLSYFPPLEPELPLFSQLGECLVELFRRAVAYPDTGARLYNWMQLAGLSKTQSNGECLMSGGVESPYYEWFAETIRSVVPRLESLGLISATELDLPTLAMRLRDEAISLAGCVMTPLIVSCSGERS